VTDFVLDASAVLALINGEPGSEVVAKTLNVAAVSAVNIAEIATRLVDRGASIEGVREQIDRLPFDIVAFDDAAALHVAKLRPETRRFGLSLGDRACLSLAERLGVPALTADRHWAKIDIGVEVRLIRG
jgi:PIN domain nuclease of toxin-antitoxin system